MNAGDSGAVDCFPLAGVLRTVLVFNSMFTINSLYHLIARQPPGPEDSRRDSRVISFISFGEGYPNDHPTYSRSDRNGSMRYNFYPFKW